MTTFADYGAMRFALMNDAYGRGPFGRAVTTLRGTVRHGDSGGPAVDANGAVETTVFASRVGSSGGFGVPTSAVRKALAGAKGPVSTAPFASTAGPPESPWRNVPLNVVTALSTGSRP